VTTNTLKEEPAVQPLRITHLFDAPRELVWEAWTNEEHFSPWWGT
jgi:uncharacterized protein YndB with AHSA1/START domain